MERMLLYRKIYNDLLQGIRDNTYPPGSRLPSEKELAEKYDVSRITSKKALEMLADQGCISRKPGKGSYVLGNAEDAGPEREAKHNDNAHTGMIGVVMDDFGPSFGCDIIRGIELECRKRNYYMILKCTYGSVEEEDKALNELAALGVEGIILMSVQGETYSTNVLRLVLEGFPIVLVDRELTGLPIPCVNTDNYTAAKELMQLLFDNGHTNICFLSHPFMQTSTVAARFNGYLDGMLEHGLTTNENMMIKDLGTQLPHPVFEEQKENPDLDRIEKFIDENPQVTAFFAVEQSIGKMVYKVLKKKGLQREKEVAFFDGIERYTDMDPSFSCVIQEQKRIGKMSVRYLEHCIKGEQVPQKSYVPHTLIKGDGYKPENG